MWCISVGLVALSLQERLALLPDMTDDDVLVSGSSVALHLLSFTCALADDLVEEFCSVMWCDVV